MGHCDVLGGIPLRVQTDLSLTPEYKQFCHSFLAPICCIVAYILNTFQHVLLLEISHCERSNRHGDFEITVILQYNIYRSQLIPELIKINACTAIAINSYEIHIYFCNCGLLLFYWMFANCSSLLSLIEQMFPFSL